MNKISGLALAMLLLGCAGARQSAAPDEVPSAPDPVVETTPVATDSAAEPHMLEGCSSSTTDAGLLLQCEGFRAVLSRLTHDSAITEEVRLGVEHDYRAGMAQSIGGELRERLLTTAGPEGQFALTGFDVFEGDAHKMSGMVLALPTAETEVLTVTCFAPDDPEATTCTAVAHDVLNRGLPDLR